MSEGVYRMPRVAWVFDNYQFPVNPETDTGWNREVILVEHNPIRSTQSVFQYLGTRSARRRITGWMYGPKADEMRSKFEHWLTTRKVATLKDHLNVSRNAVLVSFTYELVPDYRAWRQQKPTYRYNAEFVQV